MKQRGDYIILDNGAAEGTLYGPKHLFTLAEQVGADEIVVPDAMGDARETISQYLAFIPYADPDYKYMVVLQGNSMEEVQRCLAIIDTNIGMIYATTIGIPRILNKIHPRFRETLTTWLKHEAFDERFEFHYLGATPEWNNEVVYLADMNLGRGLDTSKPIYMGLNRQNITRDEDMGRPDDYFHITYDTVETEFNVNRYMMWAGYETSTVV